MIYVTGDTHIPIDIHKLSTEHFPEGQKLTKEDYVIVCGDFGLLWEWKESGMSVETCPEDTKWTKEELYWKEWLDEKPWTTLWVDGNHENYDRLKMYPIEEWNGGYVQKISDSIIHLMRGQYYDIDGTTVFTLGGANSHDRGPATGTRYVDEGVIWWPEEKPASYEILKALENMGKHNNKVDLIITHEVPMSIRMRLNLYDNDDISMMLQAFFNNVDYKHWFAGHHHCFYDFHGYNLTVLYQDIVCADDYLVSA